MNHARKVFFLVTVSTTVYFIVSLLATVYNIDWLPLSRINLISEVVSNTNLPKPLADTAFAPPETPASDNTAVRNFERFTVPHSITAFNKDTMQFALQNLVKKLHDLKTGKKTKIRIAYMGDSMIEGDLLTQTLRKLLQQEFGGSGVGFVPITSQVSKFRTTVSDDFSDTWKDENFKNASGAAKSSLFLSGHIFRSSNAWVSMNDNTVIDTTVLLEKSLLCGYAPAGTNVSINNANISINAPDKFNRVILSNDLSHKISLRVSSEQLPVYGVSFESESGVFVDNFSFRGISGIELAAIDSSFLQSVAANNNYDVIILQYGVNVLFRPNDKNFSWYGRAFNPVIGKFIKCFPASDIVVISTADRAFRYNGNYASAVGIDSLIKVQATLAFENGACFYNQFATMGGTNSIVNWAAQKPPLANKDYVHPNHNGAAVLGEYFFTAIMNDYQKYVQQLNSISKK